MGCILLLMNTSCLSFRVKAWLFRKGIPGILAGEIGPDRDWLLPTGEPTGEGDGPPGMLERWGDACGEKGDWAGLLWSPWLLVEPDALTAELRVASVPVGRSSMEPDRSCERKTQHGFIEEPLRTNTCSKPFGNHNHTPQQWSFPR